MKQVTAFGLAIVFSFFLFAFMNMMIDGDVGEFDKATTPPISIFMPEPDMTPVIYKRPDLKPPELKPLKETIVPQRSIVEPQQIEPLNIAAEPNLHDGINTFTVAAVVDNGTSLFPTNSMQDNAELMPKVRIEPQYPQPAALKGIEGSVTLNFDISASGDPINIAVVDASPRGYFEQNAKKALRKWKYSPKKVNGHAVSVANQTITLVFKLEKA